MIIISLILIMIDAHDDLFSACIEEFFVDSVPGPRSNSDEEKP